MNAPAPTKKTAAAAPAPEPGLITTKQMREPALRPGDPVPRTRLWRAAPVDRVLYRTVLMPSGCWEWMGKRQPEGYGAIRLGTGLPMEGTHRVVYRALVGPIPTDRPQLDHLCRNPPCCNPAHLEPVTLAENLRRGLGNQHKGKPACVNGHDYSPENTLTRLDGRTGRLRRECLTCKIERNRGLR